MRDPPAAASAQEAFTMPITIAQAQAELKFRAQPKATRVRDETCPGSGPAFDAKTAALQAIAAKSTRKQAPAKSTPAPKAPKARVNPEANDAFKAALDAGLGMKAAFRARKSVLAALAQVSELANA